MPKEAWDIVVVLHHRVLAITSCCSEHEEDVPTKWFGPHAEALSEYFYGGVAIGDHGAASFL